MTPDTQSTGRDTALGAGMIMSSLQMLLIRLVVNLLLTLVALLDFTHVESVLLKLVDAESTFTDEGVGTTCVRTLVSVSLRLVLVKLVLRLQRFHTLPTHPVVQGWWRCGRIPPSWLLLDRVFNTLARTSSLLDTLFSLVFRNRWSCGRLPS